MKQKKNSFQQTDTHLLKQTRELIINMKLSDEKKINYWELLSLNANLLILAQ